MESDDARERLTEEHERLDEIRAGFDNEHLHDESEGESTSELSHLAQHSADIASETFEREKDFSILEQVEAELADVVRGTHRCNARGVEGGGWGGEESAEDRLRAFRFRKDRSVPQPRKPHERRV
jgi:hypothetical protein